MSLVLHSSCPALPRAPIAFLPSAFNHSLQTLMLSLCELLITKSACRLTDRCCAFPQDVFRLYAFAFFLQCLIHIPYFIKANALHQPARFHIRTMADMLLYSAPPGLPLMMLLIGVVSSFRLQREKMSLLYWEVLGKGACADVVAFDKTGTLTHSVVSHARSRSWPGWGLVVTADSAEAW